MNVACDYEAPMQMLTTEKYIAARSLFCSLGDNQFYCILYFISVGSGRDEGKRGLLMSFNNATTNSNYNHARDICTQFTCNR